MASRRASYTAKYKLQVIAFAKENGNKAASKHFGRDGTPSSRTVREWRLQEEKLKKMPREKRASRGKGAKWPDLEKELKTWVVECRLLGNAVSTKMVMEEATRISREKNIDFTGAAHWCFNFMKRESLSMRTRTKLAQKMPAEYENKILQFHKYVIGARKNFDFELGQIANMDETPLTFDVPSNRTVEVKGSKTVAIKTTGHEKTHYTVVLACCADGTKLAPMLIFKRKTFPTKEDIPRGVIVHVQTKGWMEWME
jgi:hypothetical protein